MQTFTFNLPPHPKPLKRRPSKAVKYLYCNLYLVRHRMRLTQQDLARMLRISRRTLSNIENGKTIPSVMLALRIAHVLGKPVEDLFKLKESRYERH